MLETRLRGYHTSSLHYSYSHHADALTVTEVKHNITIPGLKSEAYIMSRSPTSMNLPTDNRTKPITLEPNLENTGDTIPLEDLEQRLPSIPGNDAPQPLPSKWHHSLRCSIPAIKTSVACGALMATVVFGIGAWVGQMYGNKYARESLEVSLWALCADHPVCLADVEASSTSR